jgi:hypothetical protein
MVDKAADMHYDFPEIALVLIRKSYDLSGIDLISGAMTAKFPVLREF